MKLLSVLLLAVSFSVMADSKGLSGQYLISSYDWCGGPLDGKEPGGCSYSGWNGVDLDSLVSMEITLTKESSVVAFKDLNGASWTSENKDCNIPSPKPSGGCEITWKENGDRFEIHLSQWRFNKDQSILLTIKDSELTILDQRHAFIVFGLKKVSH